MNRSHLSSAKRGFKNITVSLSQDDWANFRVTMGRLGARSYSQCVLLMIEHMNRENNAQGQHEMGRAGGSVREER